MYNYTPILDFCQPKISIEATVSHFAQQKTPFLAFFAVQLK
jgi:hypothetical protein